MYGVVPGPLQPTFQLLMLGRVPLSRHGEHSLLAGLLTSQITAANQLKSALWLAAEVGFRGCDRLAKLLDSSPSIHTTSSAP